MADRHVVVNGTPWCRIASERLGTCLDKTADEWERVFREAQDIWGEDRVVLRMASCPTCSLWRHRV